MPDWSLTDIPLGGALRGIAGYAVLSGLGLRLGYVTGWVKDPDARVQMIKLAVQDGYKTKEYLVPIGSVTLIDDGRSQIHLRELTKPSLPKFCTEFDGELPEPRLLKSLIRFFPNPRPSVVERLEDPETSPPPISISLPVDVERGDGARPASMSLLRQEPEWVRLGHLALPAWTRLSTFSTEASQRQA